MIMVRFFGRVAERIGRDRVEIAYRDGMNLQDLIAQLQPLFPGAFSPASTVVVNGMRFRDMSLPLEEGCEVVFMNP